MSLAVTILVPKEFLTEIIHGVYAFSRSGLLPPSCTVVNLSLKCLSDPRPLPLPNGALLEFCSLELTCSNEDATAVVVLEILKFVAQKVGSFSDFTLDRGWRYWHPTRDGHLTQ